jgi:Nif-specific regulatory protein
VPLDIRILATSNRDMAAEVRAGHFREDLYYRLNVFPLEIPSLRERPGDIVPLARKTLAHLAAATHRAARFAAGAEQSLQAYAWPGNVRELENSIERAVLLTTNDVVNAYDLPPSLQTAEESGTAITPEEGASFETMVASFEKELIVDALKNNRWNVAAAARALKTTQRIIHYKIGKLGIEIQK